MRRRASFSVAAAVAAHLGFLIYLPSGGFLALRWRRSRWLHAVAVGWGLAVVFLKVPCPLTALEERARARAGMAALPAEGFVAHYVDGRCYPPGATSRAQQAAFTAAGVSWLLLILNARRRGVSGGLIAEQ
ncbi:DUF2784 domain-containing protein [Mycolicibacterium sp.]|uniref:DUF2784 domain-containing protein n=1 Tax=Mycolicibacterium sp. TaxID=2320850 RepID=UPI003D0E6702